MQLLLLATGLSLFSAVQAELPPLVPARAEELPGTWYMVRWAGDMPIPEETKNHPMPPFTMRINNQNKLEFRMNLMKPIGCIEFKLPLDSGTAPGAFVTRWKHTIYIYFLPGKTHAIAYFRGYMNYMYYQMMMLMGASRPSLACGACSGHQGLGLEKVHQLPAGASSSRPGRRC
ncbi:lipocalin-1-like [Octodon degus]|uniref:Lipocalin-1-like n=1 Tax=Octodon degus TaxID=10160 RepID=A0A6P6D7F4_OCTDE|nr:lipocalin-1-like [Octodon degus]